MSRDAEIVTKLTNRVFIARRTSVGSRPPKETSTFVIPRFGIDGMQARLIGVVILLLTTALGAQPGQRPDEVPVNPGIFVDGPESYLLPLYLKPTSLVVVGTITEVAPELLGDGSPATKVRLRPTEVLKGQAPGRHQDIEAWMPGAEPFVVGKSYFVALTLDHGRLWLAPPSAIALLDGDSVVGLSWNQREWVDRVIAEGIEKRPKSRGVESRRKVFLEEVRAALKGHERDKHGNTKSRK